MANQIQTHVEVINFFYVAKHTWLTNHNLASSSCTNIYANQYPFANNAVMYLGLLIKYHDALILHESKFQEPQIKLNCIARIQVGDMICLITYLQTNG